MRSKANNQNRFMRLITLPIRVLSKARAFYVRSMIDCAGRVSYGNVVGGPAGQVSSLPKSFSVNSSRSNDDEDLRELIRAASTTSLGGNRAEMRRSTAAGGVPRSCSVGMGRIDEDRPCEFGDDNINVRPDLLYPRSRSYAITTRSVVF